MFLNAHATASKTALPLYAGWTLAVLSAVGCANPGPPRPPSLNLPTPVRDLEVHRVADRIEAAWTTSRLTTEKSAIPGAITAVLCLENPSNAVGVSPGLTIVTPATGSACVEAARKVVLPGASALTVALAPELAAGPPRLLVYRVELINSRGRSAGRSNAGWSVAGAAPAAAEGVQVGARPEGVLVTWKSTPPGADSGAMELVRRTLVAAPRSGSGLSGADSSFQNPALSRAGAAHPPPTSNEVHMGAVEGEITPSDGSLDSRADSGGLLDRSVESGATYSYVAQRARDVTLAGQTLRILGEASAPATLAYRDVFPPSAPGGLEAVPEGGFVAALGPASALAVSLSWEPSPESDVAGYNVYRSAAADQFLRLNAAPLAAPAYRDATVQSQKRYRYRVTAVDLRNNESVPGTQVEVQLQP